MNNTFDQYLMSKNKTLVQFLPISRNRAPLSNYRYKFMSLIFIKLFLIFVTLEISLFGLSENYEIIYNAEAGFLKIWFHFQNVGNRAL